MRNPTRKEGDVVPTLLFKARQRRADGTPILTIETPYEFDVDQAACALAIVYAHEPMRTGVHALRNGLRTAAETRVLDQEHTAPEQAVAAYRDRLTSPPQIMFPDPTLREVMLDQYSQDKAGWRAADPATRPRTVVPRPGQPYLWSKHTREDGSPVVRIEVPRFYDLDQAAHALALVHTDQITPRAKEDAVPRHTSILRTQLQQAGRLDVLSGQDATARRRREKVDAGLVDAYRAVLLEQGVFPNPAT